jgi:hypothetical protein
MRLSNNLFLLTDAKFGGWITFAYHLAKVLKIDHVVKVKKSFMGGGVLYGDIFYKNIKTSVINKFKNPIILAVDKKHRALLSEFKQPSTIIIHDPTELCDEVVSFAKKNNVITIRQTMHDLLKKKGVRNTFLKHPFFRYNKVTLQKKYTRSLSRVDFDKNIDIICKANNIGANIEIYGYKNPIYYHHKLRQLNFDQYYKGQYQPDIKSVSTLYAESKFIVDLSVIKGDGGGTQYTFLDAEFHGCGLILHDGWCRVDGSIYRHGYNCYAVKNEHELAEAVKWEPLIPSVLPSDDENNQWKTLFI